MCPWRIQRFGNYTCFCPEVRVGRRLFRWVPYIELTPITAAAAAAAAEIHEVTLGLTVGRSVSQYVLVSNPCRICDQILILSEI
jgi:hypothetical protein